MSSYCDINKCVIRYTQQVFVALMWTPWYFHLSLTDGLFLYWWSHNKFSVWYLNRLFSARLQYLQFGSNGDLNHRYLNWVALRNFVNEYLIIRGDGKSLFQGFLWGSFCFVLYCKGRGILTTNVKGMIVWSSVSMKFEMCQKNEGGPSPLHRRSISRRPCYKRMQIFLIGILLRETFHLPHA